jgi:hypothetical protein
LLVRRIRSLTFHLGVLAYLQNGVVDDNALREKMSSLFPLPNQASWSVFHLTSATCTRVTSVLQTRHNKMEEWRRLPKIGSYIGSIGAPIMSSHWDWTLTFRRSHSKTVSDASQDLPLGAELATMVFANRSKLEQSLRLSWQLVRRFLWPSG